MTRQWRRLAPALAGALFAGVLSVSAGHASASGVVISEFRFRGPAGGNDEFVELANVGTAPVDISGWRLEGCAGASGSPSLRTTVPSNVVLEPGEHFLFVNSGAYSGAVPADATYSTGIADDGGVRISTAAQTKVDGVANQDASADQCREGTGLSIPTSTSDNSFERKDGGTRDTDDNAADFDGPKIGAPENHAGDGGGGPTITKIHEIQGPGADSPQTGRTVVIEGVVTGWDDEVGSSFTRVFPEDAGIFVQEEPADEDGDARTSEGIFVGFVRPRTDYPLGTVVRLQGEVKEKFGLTMMALTRNTTPEKVGATALPEPITIDATAAAAQDPWARAYYEALENMRVRLATGVANSGGTNKFGELFLTPGTAQDRVFRTDAVPDLIATDNDAGAGDPNNPLRPERTSTTVVNADLFDRVDDAIGPLSFAFGNYKIMVQPGNLPTVTSGPTTYPFDGVAPPARHELRLASFNVENFFRVGADLDRGTVSEQEYIEKRTRIADAIDELLERPHVIAVQEVANLTILEDLAATLGGYRAYLEEGNDSRGIDVGFLVRKDPWLEVTNVRQLGKDAAGPAGVTCSDVRGNLFDRPPLAMDVAARRVEFTIFSNHFSSKSAPDACREAQAAFVRDRVAEIEAAGGQAVVAGDLNAFEDEGALAVLEDGTTTLTNLWSRAPADERYSFAFQGRLQTLDHVLVTDGLERWFGGFLYAHFDNDYYHRDDPSDGHKVSDHDPPVATFGMSGRP